jgi:carboxyl-terminal processing protease
MKSSKEYSYLLEDITEFNKRDAEVSLPLSEAVSKKQRDEMEAKNLNRENERRVSRGLAPLKKGEIKPVKEENYDFIRDEAMQIITDFISDPRIAKNKKM